MRRALIATTLAGGLALAAPSAAMAQEPAPQPPAEVTCYPLLSSLVCHIPVNVGPFGPFEFNFPNGIFGPPAGTTP